MTDVEPTSSVILPPPPPASWNTSGQGKEASVPVEIDERWNWAAFLMPFVFAIVYRSPMWIAIGAIPIVLGLVGDHIVGGGALSSIASIVIGFSLARRANTIAWRARRWESVERFLQVQRRLGWLFLAVSLVLAGIVFSNPPEDSVATPDAGAQIDATGVRSFDDHDVAFEHPGSWDPDASDRVTGIGWLQNHSKWVVFLGPPGADLVTIAVLDLPDRSVEAAKHHKRAFARQVVTGVQGTMRGEPVMVTLDGAPAMRFGFDSDGAPLGPSMTTDFVVAFPGEDLLIVRCDYERDDPNGTAAGCDHLLDTFEVTGSMEGDGS